MWVNGFNQVVQIQQRKNIWIDDDTIWVDDQSNHGHLEGETGLGEVKHKAGMDGCRYGCHNDTCEYPRVPRNGWLPRDISLHLVADCALRPSQIVSRWGATGQSSSTISEYDGVKDGSDLLWWARLKW
jgi:hypothetical protein